MKYIKLFEEFLNEIGPAPDDTQIAGPTPYDNIKKKKKEQMALTLAILNFLHTYDLIITPNSEYAVKTIVSNVRQFILNAIHPTGVAPGSDGHFNIDILSYKGKGYQWASLYNIDLSNNVDVYKLAGGILEYTLNKGWLNKRKYKFNKGTLLNKIVDIIKEH
jgi:hypothetical protein